MATWKVMFRLLKGRGVCAGEGLERGSCPLAKDVQTDHSRPPPIPSQVWTPVTGLSQTTCGGLLLIWHITVGGGWCQLMASWGRCDCLKLSRAEKSHKTTRTALAGQLHVLTLIPFRRVLRETAQVLFHPPNAAAKQGGLCVDWAF